VEAATPLILNKVTPCSACNKSEV